MGSKYWKAKDSALGVFDGKVKEVIADLSNFYYGEKTEVIVDGKHYMKPVYDNKEEGLYVRVNGIRLCYDDFDIPVGNDIVMSSKNKSSKKPIKSGISPEQNKFNWAYNDWFGHFQMNLDRVPQYLEGVKWCDANKGTSEYEQLCEEYNCYPVDDREKASFYNALKQVGAITSSKKPIKSSWLKPEDTIAYLVGGDKDTITITDEDEAAAYNTYYYGYGIMDDGEKGHMFIGKYSDVKEFVENYLGLAWSDEFAYPYILSGTEVTKYFQNLPSKPLPTEKDYQDFVNQLNKYVAENYETHGSYGPIYLFNMYKGEGTNSDGYGHEYPNFIIYDDEGNLDMHSDDDITEYIRNELKAKGWYPEAVHSSSDFTIAVM